MNAINFLSSPVADALGWTLLHAIWQGFALVLPIAATLHLFRNQASALRYRVGVLTLLTQLVVSAATFIWCYQPTVTNQPLLPSVSVRFATQISWQTVTQTLPWHQQTHYFLEEHLSQFVLIYLIGVALFGLRLAGGWVYLQRLSRTATPPVNKGWGQLTDRLRSALAIRAVVQVRESARIAVPMVVGVLKPVLLLPIGLATSLSMREIEAVLAHELAHIKRHDYAVNLLQSVVEVLYFFHPALWWLSARVREEREHCCDDLAVQVCGGDGHILAQALARVEELRLAQMDQTPALAMAFASKRQHLLHRVRRMLGVPTRPFVSNGSLAGLTLATLLLMSVSVYAVQKQDEPKRKTTQPKPTRRHKVDGNSEYGMAGNKKVSYIVWKGQKLPTARVAKLQRQLDQVMTGQLSLDDVPQADRDILLTIIEKNESFDEGMESLSDGLAHLDYNTIIKTGMDAANAAGTFPVNVDEVLKEVEKIDYNNIINGAMASVSHLRIPNDTLDRQRAFHQRQMDSLTRLIDQRAQQVEALHRQMENLRFPVEEAERSQQVLEWRKEKLEEQRHTLIEKHQQLMHNDGKQKLNLTEVEKQLAALEPEIKKQETSIDALNRQLEEAEAKIKSSQQPLEKLEREAEQLNEQVEELSREMSKHDEGMARMIPMEEAKLNYENAVRRIRPARPPYPARASRPYRTIRPVIAPNVIHPPAPPAPARIRATPALAPTPVVPATPRSEPKPKPVIAPTPPRP
ncbi:M56 family metallopeptidase [Spirosoma areae]